MNNRRGLLLAMTPVLGLLLVAGLSLAQDDSKDVSQKALRKELTQEAKGASPSRPVAMEPPKTADSDAPSTSPSSTSTPTPPPAESTSGESNRSQVLIASLTIFALAVFVGFEVITKVPPTLHTPLMSGSNAISGITLVGAVILAARSLYFSPFIAFLAVILATVNVVGGFLVTHRMLAMFKKR
ncbi:MAG: NAD(P) transhydrogenase subunit alpha [Pirellulaceae bacterium]